MLSGILAVCVDAPLKIDACVLEPFGYKRLFLLFYCIAACFLFLCVFLVVKLLRGSVRFFALIVLMFLMKCVLLLVVFFTVPCLSFCSHSALTCCYFVLEATRK
ncbi:putative mucin-associated surface protein (MASP) [Trypanosoma cruzi Dm28c]|uniref:Putative mucin-associated surface protein (MASP) n=1 Tax=Trypanosoma cruzi Dm28c TaxID=1416333 RepID=V5A2X3_TRYCR|nr:putative mucin-associated surface protein (MASP) [Trypanosoma cruzi Dm28c]